MSTAGNVSIALLANQYCDALSALVEAVSAAVDRDPRDTDLLRIRADSVAALLQEQMMDEIGMYAFMDVQYDDDSTQVASDLPSGDDDVSSHVRLTLGLLWSHEGTREEQLVLQAVNESGEFLARLLTRVGVTSLTQEVGIKRLQGRRAIQAVLEPPTDDSVAVASWEWSD